MPLQDEAYINKVAAAYKDLYATVLQDGDGTDRTYLLDVGWIELQDILLGLGLLAALRRHYGDGQEAEAEALYKRLCGVTEDRD